LTCRHDFVETGFSVNDGATSPVRFCSEFDRLGGLDTLGYPISTPFKLTDGFHYQAFQRAILQWRADSQRAELVNTFDILHNVGKDGELDARGVPAWQPDASGGDWEAARTERWTWLEDAGITARYLASPLPELSVTWDEARSTELYGLPTSRPERRGPFVIQRFQRIALQRWVDATPGMPLPGTVVGVLGGDLLKEFGLVPADATSPRPAERPDAYVDIEAPIGPISLWQAPLPPTPVPVVEPMPTVPEPTATPPASAQIWQPGTRTPWQWQLTTPVATSVDVPVYDIDLFDNDASVVAALHAEGRRVICYMSVGSWENWRPDASKFPESVKGPTIPDWPDERWLDIRQLNVVGPIIEARFDLCKARGFDAIEPDWIDNYVQKTGFPISYADQITYNTFLANAAHARGLSIGLKNDLYQVADLLPIFDWALNEQCFEFAECDTLRPFVAAGKAVFQVEYNLDPTQFCPQANAMNFNSMKKNRELDAYRLACR
jgi:hypothetical protein